MKWWVKIIIAVMAMVILYVSFVMASLDRVIDDETFDRLRKIQISYTNAKNENQCYKLPESNVLPNNFFYPIKELRDSLWIYFSKNDINKLKILLLIRDKKIEEILLLQESKSDKKVIEKQIEKIEKMSDKLDNEFVILDKRRPESSEVQKRIGIANEFYKFIYEKFLNKEKIEKCYE